MFPNETKIIKPIKNEVFFVIFKLFDQFSSFEQISNIY